MLDAENVEYYLLGDLNCDLGSPDLESNSRSLIGITELYGLHQLISEPTRITETSSTMIDHIFTNTPDKIVCSGVSHVGISDHSLLRISLICAFRIFFSLPNGVRRSTFDAGLVTKIGAFSSFHQYFCHSRQDIDYLY